MRWRSWAKDDFTQAERDAFAERCTAIAAAAERLAPLLAHLEKIDPEQLALLAPALASLAADAEERLRRSGRVSFEDLLTRAAELLAEHPRVAADLRRGIDQLLVDEFQDTDARQCAIVASLALEGAADDRPGLFLVGDPKQSIYGWRNADLEAYERMLARVREAGGSVGTLCVNHRSVPAILREVERVVAPVMVRAAESPARVRSRSRRASRARRRRASPRAAARRSSSGCRRSATIGRPARDARGRGGARSRRARSRAICASCTTRTAWRGASFGVLFRSRGDWDVYLGALREAGIPFSVEGDRTYYRRREIVDAVGFVCCVLDPNDQLALLTLLRSSAAGVPDAAWLPLWEAGFPKLAARLGFDADALAALEPMLRSAAEAIDGQRARTRADRGLGARGVRMPRGDRRTAPQLRARSRRRVRRAAARGALLRGGRGGALPRRRGARPISSASSATSPMASAAGEPVGALLRRIRRAVAEEETPSAETDRAGLARRGHRRDAARREGPRLGSRVPDAAAQGRRAQRRRRARSGASTGCSRRPGAACPTLAFDAVQERRPARRGGRARAHALRGHDARARAAGACRACGRSS